MNPPRPREGARTVVFAGGGLSVASEIPPHLDDDGLFDGRPLDAVASTDAWRADREAVMRFYDARRLNCVAIQPNDAHEGLARLQHRWGARRLTLATTSIDGLLAKAGAVDVLEMNGSLWSICCEADFAHPHLQVAGPQRRERKCSVCQSAMRPDVRWPGEPWRHLERLREVCTEADTVLVVGADLHDPVVDCLAAARAAGARCVEINPIPTGWAFDLVLAQAAEDAVPRLVAEWLGEV